MVQRYPQAFDGVIAGASAYTMLEKVQRYLWEDKYGFDEHGQLVFTPEAGELLHRAVMESCDGRDGLVDGQIDDPRRCDYDPGLLQCQPDAAGAGCLSAAQVRTARAFYDGPRTADGKRLFQGGEPYGAELTWGTSAAFANAGRRAAEGFVRYFLPAGSAMPDFRAEDWEFSEASLRRLQSADHLLDAKNADLAAFRAAGGKLILWQGAADYAAGPRAIFEYYHAVRALSGGTAQAREFARLFLIPGVYHCRGGYVPYEEDLLGAMVAWVEAGQAPDSVEAAAVLDDGTVRRRPVHAYPTVTRYSGSGDINDPQSFEGVAPDTPPDDRWDWLGTFTADLPPS
jgi:feruloyl esterase